MTEKKHMRSLEVVDVWETNGNHELHVTTITRLRNYVKLIEIS